jgi:glyoxalase family protein
MSDTSQAIQRHHHITLCVGGAQEDYDFHTLVLGLKSVKKTALYDGDVPIYHLYYGNDTGAESTLVTTFPMHQSGAAAGGVRTRRRA